MPNKRSQPLSSSSTSTRNLAVFESIDFDLAIVGGGITGAGIARHAAKCGLKVALLEANDYASGTSSRSSKLIHGGLRYLAMGDIGLVRETALERKNVHKIAPHLAEAAWMVLPVKSRASLLKFRAGIGTYERLGAVAVKDRHKNFDAAGLAEFEPALDRERYPWACAYREYVTDDARLVLAVLRGARLEGAMIANYLEVTGHNIRDGKVVGLKARCKITNSNIQVKARVVVNATGPWVEKSIEAWENHKAKVSLHLSKGVHIVVPHERLPLKNIVVMNTSDKRSTFAVPRGDITYIGTTDTSYAGLPTLWPEIEQADVDYLLETIPKYFPGVNLVRNDVVAAWAGLRPLVHEPGKSSRELSRKDEIWIGDKTGMISMAGGKLTGFRKMAEDAVAVVGKSLGYDLVCKDPLAVLPGGNMKSVTQASKALADSHKLSPDNALRLTRLYGSEAAEVIALNNKPVAKGSRIFCGEVDWAIIHDSALTLEDVLYRRLRTVWFEPDEVVQVLQAIASRMANQLGWSEEEKTRQIELVNTQILRDNAF